MSKFRCSWVPANDPLYQKYHDEEWGVVVQDDVQLFEFLTLEGAQAGLSWRTVLGKRANYKLVFYNWDIQKISKISDKKLEIILKNPGIIRNRLKIFSVRKNAKVFLEIQKEFGSFSSYIWGWSNNVVIKNSPKSIEDIPTKTELSDNISKDLKKRGMSFVGSTIVYAYLQAIGIVDDHQQDCFAKQ